MNKSFLRSNKIFSFFLVVFLLISFLVYNGGKILADNLVLPYICESGTPPQNDLHAPLGQAMDQVRHLGYEIIEETDALISAEASKMGSALEIPVLVKSCGPDKCLPQCEKGQSVDTTCASPNPWPSGYTPCDDYICGGCPLGLQCFCRSAGCESEMCIGKDLSGQPCLGCIPCPPEIDTRLSEVLTYAGIVKEKYNRIDELLRIMQTEVTEKLQTSRTVLRNCTTTESEVQQRLAGKRAGRQLMSCQAVTTSKITIHSLLDGVIQEKCYGTYYCYEKSNEGINPENLPYPPPPCGEDFFCCY